MDIRWETVWLRIVGRVCATHSSGFDFDAAGCITRIRSNVMHKNRAGSGLVQNNQPLAAAPCPRAPNVIPAVKVPLKLYEKELGCEQ